MYVRAWGYVAALGLTLAGALLEAQERQSENQVEAQPRQAEPAPERPPEAPAREVRPEPTQVPGAEHDRAAEPNGEPSSDDEPVWPRYGDGLAQWIMAGLGIPAVALSWWAVVLLKRTLKATKDTLEEAKRSAVAAQEAVVVTREIGEAQTRAYMVLEPHVRWFKSALNPGEVRLNFVIQAFNRGMTPAKIVAAYASVRRLDADAEPVDQRPDRTPQHLGDSQCAPGLSIPVFEGAIDLERINLAIARKDRIVTHARLEYMDVFKKTRFVEASFSHRVHEVPPLEDAARVHGAVTTNTYLKGNDSD